MYTRGKYLDYVVISALALSYVAALRFADFAAYG
jgi:hypothetical protein